MSPAITIALLAAIESLLSAVVADGLIGGRHRSNAELLAQGIANIASPLLRRHPGHRRHRAHRDERPQRRADARSRASSTPLTLLVILLSRGRWASLIPMATLAGILMVVAYNMSEWHVFLRLLRGPRSDVLVLLTTFVLTVAVDLTVAIQVGVVLASLLFMRRMAEVTQVRAHPRHRSTTRATEPCETAIAERSRRRGGLRDQRLLLLRGGAQVHRDAARQPGSARAW